MSIFLNTANVAPESLSSLNLAYLGDAVFELMVRTTVAAQHGNRSVNKLSQAGIKQARATAQSQFYHILQDKLTEEELAVLKRGRNAKSHSRAKNASVADYRRATGVEALFGYLYLKGQNERLIELFELSQERGVEDVAPYVGTGIARPQNEVHE